MQSSLVESRMVEMSTVKLRICFYCIKDSDSIRLDRYLHFMSREPEEKGAEKAGVTYVTSTS